MIGVAANPRDLGIAAEFFELFKTPWEPAVPGRKYRAIVSTVGHVESLSADLFLVYSWHRQSGICEQLAGVADGQANDPLMCEWNGARLPLYGRTAWFGNGDGTVRLNGEPLDSRNPSGTGTIWQFGYDLFSEVRHLLTTGQPASMAAVPTLDMHIAILRHALLQSGVAFVEIPPVPYGSDFICCLTHDVDFYGIRRHRFDRTLAGFVGRASVGTFRDVVNGRRPLGEALQNWASLLMLPLVHLRLAPDFWQPFKAYARADRGHKATFFLIPFRGRAGVAPDGSVDATRAVRYAARDVADDARAAVASGNEVAVHGLDAWRDATAGRAEMNEVAPLAGHAATGVRMHWLYFAPDSPRELEAAGFSYDSTWGYNDAIGYRAGTAQPFRAAGTQKLLELPMTIMDTALFNTRRMSLTRKAALEQCRALIAHAGSTGGAIVVNWHCRSLAPERLWGQFYQTLIDEIGQAGRAWFATASEAAAWFDWRRSIRFSQVTVAGGTQVSTYVAGDPPVSRPAVLRVHLPGGGSPRVEDEEFTSVATVHLDARVARSRTPQPSTSTTTSTKRFHDRRAHSLP